MRQLWHLLITDASVRAIAARALTFAALWLGGWLFIRYMAIPLLPLLLGGLWASAGFALARLLPAVPSLLARAVGVTAAVVLSLVACGLASLRLMREVAQLATLFAQTSRDNLFIQYQNWWQELSEALPPVAVRAVNDGLERGLAAAGDLASSATSTLVSLIYQTPWIVAVLIASVLAAYLLAFGWEFTRSRLAPLGNSPAFTEAAWVVRYVGQAVLGSLRAQLLLSLVVLILAYAALRLGGFPRPLLAALVAAVLDLIPVVGPGVLLIPWAGWNLLVGQVNSGLFLMGLWVVLQVVRRSLEPKVLSQWIGASPLEMFTATWVGFWWAGAFGALWTPLAWSISGTLARRWHQAPEPRKPAARRR